MLSKCNQSPIVAWDEQDELTYIRQGEPLSHKKSFQFSNMLRRQGEPRNPRNKVAFFFQFSLCCGMSMVSLIDIMIMACLIPSLNHSNRVAHPFRQLVSALFDVDIEDEGSFLSDSSTTSSYD